ncbi:lysosome-associated membrane glycoprotein 5-like [Sinocyclocheilus rhinocerous]|uniref:lysosome-associated membrane glycoprotein 5-like n=1 Tax=Sinocyclocheilus rhinocerous TaxID=307959 RepID=UPI0007BA80E7|nr:PREDICTED: lysosome-associated membrane glycoprotein 5-like [Sinocyclocheilus rhinocerous]
MSRGGGQSDTIFVVRENGTTCLMAEFAVKFLIPYDVLALNGIDLITEQASVSIPRGAQIAGKCGSSESELQISWINHAFTFRIFFSKVIPAETDPSEFLQQFYHTLLTRSQLRKHTPLTLSDVNDKTEYLSRCCFRLYVLMWSVNDQRFSPPAAFKCITDQREQLEQMLPLVLGLILGLIIVITISVYHFHLKLSAAQQPQLPRDRSLYKNM